MQEYLEGFEKRMEFVAIVDSIVNRKNKNTDIENKFEGNVLDNLFFTLLVYIMEQTLNENEACTLDNITAFLEELLPEYGIDFSHSDVRKLTEYMVKDILQNKGESKTYKVMDYNTGIKEMRVRLIQDRIVENNRIIYLLTDQGYDFLFRTKEIDKELDFRFEQLKLKELLKRKNYKHAVNQSYQLISMLRQKKSEIENFVYRIKRDINDIDKSEYEKLLNETYTLIDEEYETMNDIKKSVEQDELRIQKEIDERGYLDDTMKNALSSLALIKNNIVVVLSEQRNLIQKRFSLNEIYSETIKDSFYTTIVKRYDFEKEILEPLKNMDCANLYCIKSLLDPLMLPKVGKHTNLSVYYAPQGKLRENKDEDYREEMDDVEELNWQQEIEKNNALNLQVVRWLLEYTHNAPSGFTFSEFFEQIKSKCDDISHYTENKRIFLIILKLYQLGVVDFELWQKAKERGIDEANGEFDLSWSLYQLESENPDFYGLKGLEFEKTEDIIHLSYEESLCGEKMLSTIEMNDIKISALK